MAKLIRSEPYGEVIGKPGVKYMQNDKLFNVDGNEVDINGKLVAKAKTGKQEEEPVAEKEAGKPRMIHKGAGYYYVEDEGGNVVADGIRKGEAQKVIDDLNALNSQVDEALGDG